jgi:hypothetical protein
LWAASPAATAAAKAGGGKDRDIPPAAARGRLDFGFGMTRC